MSEYGDTVDITRFIAGRGLNKISQKVESSDFSIVQSYDSIRLNLINKDRRFSLGTNKSLFPFTREEARVQVIFKDEAGIDHTSFQGLINEAATYEDERKETVKTVVVSFDSLFGQVQTPTIRDGLPFYVAMFLCMNQPKILENLNISLGRIRPEIDGVISDGNWFVGKTVQESMDALLLLSGSRVSIVGDGEVSVLPVERRDKVRKRFFGPFEFQNKSPKILSVKNLNTGTQRVFNEITINDQRITNDASIRVNGVRSAGSFDFGFVDNSAAGVAGRDIVDQFAWERREVEITVLSKDVQDLSLLDIVAVDSPSFLQKNSGQEFFPLWGEDIGDQVIPVETGVSITPNVHWEIFEKIEKPQGYNCMLKLREASVAIGSTAVYGSGRYGEVRYA